MLLSDAMKKDTGVYPGDGVVGREGSTWYSVASLCVQSGGFEAADVGGTNSVRVEVPNGTYQIEARLIDFAGSLCVSRIRARLDGTSVSLGESRKKVSVDFAAVALADLRDIRNGLNGAEIKEFGELLTTFMNVNCDLCQLNFESKTVQFVVCKSGFGDGSYPVFTLVSGNEIVGLEVEFIKDGHVLKDFH